jgi:hypothetical protein
MANWRQIQGRIRRARTSADPVGKLTELYQKTRDAMVAYEIACFEEKAAHNEEAVRWFTAAAERFRRAEWKQKVNDALTRLGAPIPASREETPSAQEHDDAAVVHTDRAIFVDSADEASEPGSEDDSSAPEISSAATSENAPAPSAPGDHKGKRRRGRRGGRRHKRRKGGIVAAPVAPAVSHAPRTAPPGRAEIAAKRAPEPEVSESIFTRAETEPVIQFAERVTYVRAGEPALASRFAQLESRLRRLISSPLHRVDEVEEAPAGPGVFLLSDSELMTNYYVEACQTLRVGAAQLIRAGRAGRGARTNTNQSLRSQMAEHLEINEAKVSDYLRKHCVVRWLQLDEDAPYLAHFAIAVLRPLLNLE